MSQPETKLLLTCLRPVCAPGSALSATVRHDIDWQRFLTLATNHHVIPLVYQALKHEPSLPASVRAPLRQAFMAIAAYNLRATCRLQRLQSQAHEQGINLIPVKGPALAILAFGQGHESARQFEDLDLIVHPDDMARTIEWLESLGYQTDGSLRDAHRRQAYIRTKQDWSFKKAGDPLPLELKPTLIWHVLSGTNDMEWLSKSCRSIPIDDKHALSVPCPEAMLLVLCIDGTHDKWSKLSTMADIAQLLHAYPDGHWTNLLDDAKALGHKRALLIGIELTRHLLECVVPAAFTSAIQHDKKAQRMARREADRLRNNPSHYPRLGELCVFAFRTRERLRDRLRFISRLLFIPSITDIHDFKLPPALFPIYALIRPVRLIRDILKPCNKRPKSIQNGSHMHINRVTQ